MLFCFPLIAQANQTLDSLLSERDQLLDRYREIISSPRASPDTERQIFALQHQIIEMDNVLFSDHITAIQQQNETLQQSLQQARLSQTEAERRAGETERNASSYNQLLQLIIAVLFILMVVFLILTTSLAIKNRKLRSLNTEEESNKSATEKEQLPLNASRDKVVPQPAPEDELRLQDKETQKLRDRISELESQAGETHIKIISLKNEKQKLEEKIKTMSLSRANPPAFIHDQSDDPERLVLEHQLSDARAMLEDLTDQNKLMSRELEKTIQAERNLIDEASALNTEIDALKNHEQDLMHQLKTAQHSLMDSGRHDEHERVEKLNQQIAIYREQLLAEKQAREKFEKEIYAIIKDYNVNLGKL